MQQTRQQQPFRCMEATEEATTAIEVEATKAGAASAMHAFGRRQRRRRRSNRGDNSSNHPGRGNKRGENSSHSGALVSIEVEGDWLRKRKVGLSLYWLYMIKLSAIVYLVWSVL